MTSALTVPELEEAARRHASPCKDVLRQARKLLKAGDLEGAERAALLELARTPEHPSILAFLGELCIHKGEPEAAERMLLRALDAGPPSAQVINNLSVIYGMRGAWSLSAQRADEARAMKPDMAEAYYNLGNARREQGLFHEAIACYQEAIALKKDYCEAHGNLGIVLSVVGDADGALKACARAVRLRPDSAEAQYNLGNALRGVGRLEEAVEAYRASIRRNERHAMAHNNLGVVLQDLGKVEEAITSFRRALRLMPEDAGTHMNLAFALLLSGRLPEGWEENRWRWQSRKYAPKTFEQPLWNGEPLKDETLLLHCEQGYGDTIFLMRYAAMARERVGRIIALVQPPLQSLMERCAGVSAVYAEGAALPDFDRQVPLFELPRIFGTTLGSIPSRPSYLSPDGQASSVADILGTADGRRVGIAWQGNPKHQKDSQRSVPLEHFAALADLPDTRFYSLQVGAAAGQLARKDPEGRIVDLSPAISDFASTARIIAGLDLVISCDSAVAHLAGALGVPCWVLLPQAPDWRWFLDRGDSPWYPSLRLFRQEHRGDWESVFRRVRSELGVPRGPMLCRATIHQHNKPRE